MIYSHTNNSPLLLENYLKAKEKKDSFFYYHHVESPPEVSWYERKTRCITNEELNLKNNCSGKYVLCNIACVKLKTNWYSKLAGF